ncbi:carboxypeptidase regulatory-like domain-containing protein [Corallococcus sp. BB11-1]|uniref:MSCRAMM family protein n=1 Tax=Corallococcus sp. BB11-1 TaxID=2996783 RepID=UPI00227095D7|nr:carboxypeptidase regulatory-like domain-containing protein [Corallococcus sp. BB11-1]MCY1033192.1 carboxypeptidase regulatory-like domain-containing protein [Corallococcus sp. BB11-1]
MRRPIPLTALLPRLLVLLLALLCPRPVRAEPPEPERASLRLRYGLSVRQGQQVDVGPGLTYKGVTPNDGALTLTGWAAGPVGHHLGGQLDLQRESFDLKDASVRVTGGSLARGSVGPRGRLFLGPVRLEVGAGYGFAQLPLFGGFSSSPVLQRGVRHAALVSGRVAVSLPADFQLEARGELPLTLSAHAAGGLEATSTGYVVGAALLHPVVQRGAWTGTLLLDVQQAHDTMTLEATGLRSEQRLRRIGLALEVSWRDDARASRPVEGPTQGFVPMRVVDAETGAPLAGARVRVPSMRTPGASEELVTDAQGQVRALLPSGAQSARVSVEGYEEVTEQATVSGTGENAPVQIRLRKKAPPTGSLKVKVVQGRGGAPLPDVRITAGAVEARTDVKGEALLEGLAPGPVAVSATAQGFRAAEEAAVVVEGQSSELVVVLSQERKGELATLLGQVRSARSGQPLVATVSIPQAKVRSRTDKAGSFTARVRGGTYRITLSAPGYRPQTKTVTVRDGEQAIFNVDLFPRAR